MTCALHPPNRFRSIKEVISFQKTFIFHFKRKESLICGHRADTNRHWQREIIWSPSQTGLLWASSWHWSTPDGAVSPPVEAWLACEFTCTIMAYIPPGDSLWSLAVTTLHSSFSEVSMRLTDCSTCLFPWRMSAVSTALLWVFVSLGFTISLQVSNWTMTFSPQLLLGSTGAINFRLFLLAPQVLSELAPWIRSATLKSLLFPTPPLLSLSPSFPYFGFDKTGPDKTTGKVWAAIATGPSQPKQLEAKR